jgi:hypothetical protein
MIAALRAAFPCESFIEASAFQRAYALRVFGAPRRREMSVMEGVIQIDCRFDLVAGERIGWVTGRCEASRQRPPMGGRAILRAVTRVNPEQASKVEMWTPTRPKTGEGSTDGEATDACTRPVHRGSGDGTSEGHLGQRGRSGLGGGSGSKRRIRRRPVRKSERVVVPLKPGNAGGGKGPCFWCACKAGKDR